MAGRREKREALSEQIADWYKRARHDLEKARDDLERGWYPDSCFYAQQAREKILKAYLRSKGVIVRTHRDEELLLLARDQGLNVDDLLKDADVLEELSDQYLAPCYPNFRGRVARKLEDYDKGLAESCLRMVMRIWSKVEEAVKQWISDQLS